MLATAAAAAGPSGVVTDFFERVAVAVPPVQFAEPNSALRRWHELILRSQAPAKCERLCQCVHIRGGFFSNMHHIASCVMEAALQGCALIDEDTTTTARISNYLTSAAFRQRCKDRHGGALHGNANGLHCYFRPLSNCTRQLAGVKPGARLPNVFLLGPSQRAPSQALLARVQARTGLTSELLALSAATAWVMRPSPDLEEAVRLYGEMVGAGGASAGHPLRCVGMHMRSPEKGKGYAKLAEEVWRIEAPNFRFMGQRVAQIVGAQRVWLMSDSYNATLEVAYGTTQPSAAALERSEAELFRIVPAPLSCSPGHRAGALANTQRKFTAATFALGAVAAKAQRTTTHESAGDDRVCGPEWLQDDGLMLIAGVILLANCMAFVGSMGSNVGNAVVELMATLNFPPAQFDILNDVHPGLTWSEIPWHAGIGPRRKESEERLATRGGDP